MKFIARVPPGRLTRLDAEYYEPAALAVDSLVRSRQYKLLGDCIQEGYRVVYHGVDEVADGASIPFLAPSDIDENGDYDVDQIATNVPVQYLARYPKGLTKANEVLIEVKGNTAKVALVQEADTKAFMVSGSLYKAQVKADTDPRFMASYLSCTHGSRLKRRVISNVNISYIGKDDLYGLPTPAPYIDAQSYIGSKVRQAEILRAWARETLAIVSEYHDSLFSSLVNDTSWRPFKLSSQELYDLLTSEAYPPDVAEYFRSNSSISLGKACEIIFSGTTRPNVETAQDGVEQATSRSCTGQFIRRPCNYVVPPRTRDKFLRRGDIIVTNAAHDKSYVGKDYTLYHDNHPNLPSTKVLVLRPSREHFPASYLHHVLKSPLGYRQTQAVIRGISAGIAPDDMERICIPLPTLAIDDRERWFALDQDVYKAGSALEVASCLTSSARLLVEALIEGNVTEAELIAAGKDPDADCALLARLRDDGLDGAGSRLFPDIEALFDLIEQVQVTEADS